MSVQPVSRRPSDKRVLQIRVAVMSFRPEYLSYLYGKGENMGGKVKPDGSSRSSATEKPYSDRSDDWKKKTSKSPGIRPPVTDHTLYQKFRASLPRSGGFNPYSERLVRLSKLREDDDAGQIFLTRGNPSGCARSKILASRKPHDMFAWLSSKCRKFPKMSQSAEEICSSVESDWSLSLETKYENLKKIGNLHVGVYRSKIHGRGLFSLVSIEPGEMVIEIVGEVIRSGVLKKREKQYKKEGRGCYMFGIDEELTVDGTMKGNVSRFINHSCNPNCFFQNVDINGKQRLIIFSQRNIEAWEEITCDYALLTHFPKTSCRCKTKVCRNVLKKDDAN